MEPGSRVVAVMPVYNEARFLPSVLDAIAAQTFDRERVFLAVVDGGSTDGSAEILRKWLRSSGFPGVVLVNPRRRIPISLNMAIACAEPGDVVVRLDAHTLYGPQYLADAVAALDSAPDDVACIGGAHVPLPGQTFEARVVQALYTNPLGLGWADFRCGNAVRAADSVYLGVWKADVLAATGGFNEAMEANEDAELAARLRERGYRILRVPLPCRFAINRGVVATIRQWHRYGYWRARMLRRHPRSIRMRHAVSPAAAVAVVVLACAPVRWVLLPAAVIYAAALARGKAPEEPWYVTLAATLFFPAVQFAFAAGMFAGLAAGAAAAWPRESAVAQAASIQA